MVFSMRKIDLSSFQVATSVTARTINRRIVLDLIRAQQPISRAEVARRSGLQRSTISAITDQLINEKWLVEGPVGELSRGRKPRLLQLNYGRAGILGINVRPNESTIALSDLNGQFMAIESFRTIRESAQFRTDLIRRAKQFISSRPHITCEGVGVSLPGTVDPDTQRLLFAPNLGWRDVDLRTPLEHAVGLPVMVSNAANACALGELWFANGGPPAQNLVAVTVAEGIGTGIVVNGELIVGANGAAGEFGHISIEPEGISCPCGNRGCWERYASNDAAVAFYAEHARGRRRISFEQLLAISNDGDALARKSLERMGKYLGLGIAMVVTALAPQVVVVVGEVTEAWTQIHPLIEELIHERCAVHPRIVAADQANKPRLRGTIALVMHKYFAAPRVA
jgi:predicted NBD/HSP70 family sugar kinase